MADKGNDLRLRLRAKLIRQDITMKEYARSLGISNRYLYYILDRRRTSVKVQRSLARTLGVNYEKLWGEGK